MNIKLRPYQISAIEQLQKGFVKHKRQILCLGYQVREKPLYLVKWFTWLQAGARKHLS